MADKNFHPAFTVTNIKNLIPALEMKNGWYSSWVELFKIHYRAHQVIDFIIPPTVASSSAEKDKDKVDRLSLNTFSISPIPKSPSHALKDP